MIAAESMAHISGISEEVLANSVHVIKVNKDLSCQVSKKDYQKLLSRANIKI